ncbi:MAG: potassium transporter TrkG [Arenicellales bacterium]
MKSGTAALRYAVRPRVVGYYLGQLFVALAALTLVPLLVSLYYGDYGFTWRLALVVAVLAAVSAALLRLPAPTEIQTNEALVLVALAFVTTSLLMSYPISAAGLGPLDAWFESVSGVTTTGLSTVTTVASKAHTFLFLRAWMQWYGGLGIVVLSLALLAGHHMAARRLVQSAADEPLATTARTHARRMLGVYVSLTVLGVVLLWLLGLGFFDAVAQVLAAVSTGGFSSFDGSLAGIAGWPARFAVMIVTCCGAVPLVLYYRAVRGGWREALGDVELRGLAAAVVASGLLLSWILSAGMGMDRGQSIANGMLLGMSAQTTAGFTSVPISGLHSAAKLVLIVAMTVGGGVGSTAGGIKMLRLVVILRLVQFAVRRSAAPAHAVMQPRLGDKVLEQDDIVRVLLLLFLFMAVVVLSWLAFLAAGHAPLDALFEVVSATTTTGLSTGMAAPGLAAPLKLVLCLDMLLGRLEIVALLVLFYPPTWFSKRSEAQ